MSEDVTVGLSYVDLLSIMTALLYSGPPLDAESAMDVADCIVKGAIERENEQRKAQARKLRAHYEKLYEDRQFNCACDKCDCKIRVLASTFKCSECACGKHAEKEGGDA